MSGIDAKLEYMRYLNSENSFTHHRYSSEMLPYRYVRDGDMRALEASKALMSSPGTGRLSDDPLKNLLYLSICNITLVTRFAIEGGMDAEKAYNASDLYIRRYDKARTPEEIYAIHEEMLKFFVRSVAAAKKQSIYSKHVLRCIDYINSHLHEKIDCAALASSVGLNSSYLSALFKKQTGRSMTEFIIERRVEAADSLLRSSDYELTEIAEILNFSSYSHFARTFGKYKGMSPKKYRDCFCDRSGLAEGGEANGG